MEFDVFEYTSRGGRTVNEDCAGYSISEEFGVFLVADGLGGHSLGEVASATVKDIVLREIKESNSELPIRIEETVEKANEAVLNIQKERKQILKSTLALLVVSELDIFLTNVGDSRVYMFRNGEIVKYTNDHSVAYKKYKAGEITREEIGFDEDQSSLLRAIGNEERYGAEIHDMNLAPQIGDAFLLCSDGFWEYVKDLEMLIDLEKSESAEEWGNRLLKRAINRVNGDNDNITVVTVVIKG